MNNKKRFVIIILILLLIFISGYLIKNNDNNTNTGINESNISKNMSSNSVNNSSDRKDNLSNHDFDSFNYDNTEKFKASSDEITAEEILEVVKKGVWWYDSQGKSTRDVKLSKPYKDKYGFWLVGAFDKKNGKFLGAVCVFTVSDGVNIGYGFTNGPEFYSDYKNIISGKPLHKSRIDKFHIIASKSNRDIRKISNSADLPVLPASNPIVSNNSDIQNSNYDYVNFDNNVSQDLNQNSHLDTEMNSTDSIFYK